MKKIFVFITLNLLIFGGCDSKPIFTNIKSTTFKIIIKGTMENDSDVAWDNLSTNATFPSGYTTEYAGTGEEAPSKIMIDIAEIRLNGDNISNYRQKIEENLDNNNDFFNGKGIELESDDPKNGKTYDTVEVFIRKMAFDKSRTYSVEGTGYAFLKDTVFNFYEDEVLGFDFNQHQVISYVDSLKDNSGELLATFPMKVSIPGGFTFDSNGDETVLEIRLNIRNFIKKYEYSFYDEGKYRLVHYYSVSDWLRKVSPGERYRGENIQAIARVYVKGNTGKVDVSGAAGASNYVIMIPADDPITDYTVSNAELKGKPTTANCYFPIKPVNPGDYVEAQIDYYLAYEKYKYDFMEAKKNCPDLEKYTQEWDKYDEGVSSFKIAPYILDTSKSSTFENVPPGEYKLYTASKPSYGTLFLDTSFSALNGGNAINVTAGKTTNVP